MIRQASPRVGHLTSVHGRHDVRIFLKECRSLAHAGYAVSLIVADGAGDETKDGVEIHDVGASRGRIDRMRRTTARVFEKARDLDLDLYHLHDPELIPIGLKLKRLGKRVIFDAHEDVPKQLLGKPYLSKPAKSILSRVFAVYEASVCGRFDAIVAATPSIRDKFSSINRRSIDINNFPLLGELAEEEIGPGRRPYICYVGGISAIRGIRELVMAMALIKSDARLQLCGQFAEPEVEREVKRMPGWARVDELGFVDRLGVREVLSRSAAGIVTFHPLPNHTDAQPNKMFEYMSAGIPVIASNFALWRDIIAGSGCGLCIDPLEPGAIAEAIDFLMENVEQARGMGERGRAAVQDQYNWAVEERKLLALYRELLPGE